MIRWQLEFYEAGNAARFARNLRRRGGVARRWGAQVTAAASPRQLKDAAYMTGALYDVLWVDASDERPVAAHQCDEHRWDWYDDVGRYVCDWCGAVAVSTDPYIDPCTRCGCPTDAFSRLCERCVVELYGDA